MIRLTIRKLLILGLVCGPLVTFAANEVTVSQDTTLVLPSDSSEYTLVAGSQFDSMDASGASFTFDMSVLSSYAEIVSADRKNLTNSLGIATTCEANQSTMTLRLSSVGAQTITLTPAGTCTLPAAPAPAPAAIDSGPIFGRTIELPSIAPAATGTALDSNPAEPSSELQRPLAGLFLKALVRGHRNEDVRRLQELLSRDKEVYPEGYVTGYFGPLTVKAVMRFQEKHGLPSVGEVGPLTRQILNAGPSGEPQRPLAGLFLKALVRGHRNDDVRRLQEVLARDKSVYPEGYVTGYFGPLTFDAVKRFQEKHGLPSVGEVGPLTRQILNKLIVQ